MAPEPALAGIKVVELTAGVAGAMTAMLLADHGADVVKVATVGDTSTFPYRSPEVWDRGKRVDAPGPGRTGRQAVAALVAAADVVIGGDRSAPFGGADLELPGGEPEGLIRCVITAYGPYSAAAGRPGYDALVSARMGLPFDQRGYEGGAPWFIAGRDSPGDPAPVPAGADQMGRQDGPVYPAVPWNSIGACLLALTGISAALLVRARTGRGQRVDTSLFQGGLLTTAPTWQRVDDPATPGYRLGYFDRRHPKGLYRCADGKWLHQWAPLEHGFVQAAAAGDRLHMPDPADVPRRTPTGDYDTDLAYELQQHPLTAAAFARFACDDWVALFAAAGKPAQPVRSPEEALDDPISRAEGCVAEIGGRRQVGLVYRLSANPTRPAGPGPAEDSRPAGSPATPDGVPAPPVPVAAASPAPAARTPDPGRPRRPAPGAALEGIVVLDLGLAQAGPYGAQTLADLGAEVIKIDNVSAVGGPATSPGLGCNRGKRSLAVDLKDPAGQAILHDLVRRADVVHHNLRTGVAERLGAGWEQLRRINPRLVYCHTRGFEPAGPRSGLPGNDQMAQALAGTWYELGSGHNGGAPIWHPSAMGDFGNGVVSAAAVLQALYQRERTGEGQFVDTSIINVGYLYNSYVSVEAAPGSAAPAPAGPGRARITDDLLGVSALCRIYPCRTGWLCLVTPEEQHRSGLLAAVAESGSLPGAAGSPDALDALADAARRAGTDADADADAGTDADLAAALTTVFGSAPAEEWAGRLDAHGVPCEVVDREFPRRLFDLPDLVAAGVVVSRPHPTMGRVEQAGHLIGLSATPGRIGPAAPLVGWHTREILAELGRSQDEIEELLNRRTVAALAVERERSTSGVQ